MFPYSLVRKSQSSLDKGVVGIVIEKQKLPSFYLTRKWLVFRPRCCIDVHSSHELLETKSKQLESKLLIVD